MKKILGLLFGILFVNNVHAANVSKVEYKWYKEEKIEGIYYPKQEKLPGYYEDENNIEYSNYSEWNDKYCSYSKDYYLVEAEKINKYEKIINTKYVKIELTFRNESYDVFKDIKVFYENQEINYKVVQNDENGIKLELDKEYNTEKLSFYIDTNSRYCIYLSNNYELTKLSLGYLVMPEFVGKELKPSNKWIISDSTFVEELSEEEIENSQFIKKVGKENACRIKEIYTYRYKIKRKYYDDNYHVFVDGYIPDIENNIVYYDNESILKEDINKNQEFIEIKQEEIAELKNNLNVNEDTNNNNSTIYKTKYVDKEVKKIPLKIYIVIIVLILIIVIQEIRIMTKNDD